MQDIFEIEAVAGFPVRKDHVMLAIKQKKIGAGYYMPYGGVVEAGETTAEAMVRELPEESKMHCAIEDIEKVGVLSIYRFKGIKMNRYQWHRMLVSIYLIHRWEGNPQDTEEMKDARWFKNDKLPLSKMLTSDRRWLPTILRGDNIFFESFRPKDGIKIPNKYSILEYYNRLPRNW